MENTKIWINIIYCIIGGLIIVSFIDMDNNIERLAYQNQNLTNQVDSIKQHYESEISQRDSTIDSLKDITLRTIAEQKAGIKIPQRFGTKELQIVFNQCHKYDLPIGIVLRVIFAESNFRYNAVSSVGAKGYMQLMPATKRYIGDKLNITTYNKYTNLKIGIYYLKYLYKKFYTYNNNRWRLTLLSYNYGIGKVQNNLALFLSDKFNDYIYLKKIIRNTRI